MKECSPRKKQMKRCNVTASHLLHYKFYSISYFSIFQNFFRISTIYSQYYLITIRSDFFENLLFTTFLLGRNVLLLFSYSILTEYEFTLLFEWDDQKWKKVFEELFVERTVHTVQTIIIPINNRFFRFYTFFLFSCTYCKFVKIK